MSALPTKCKLRNLSLSFLPCFDQTTQIQPNVIGTYNDLILCSTIGFEQDYYICNPYTRQWIALAPTPQVHRQLGLRGFTCDHPCYHRDKLVGNRTISNDIKLNAEYRYRVVRIPAVEKNGLEFTEEIYSSETGEWRESVISSSQGFSFTSDCIIPGVAYNGMLYWISSGGVLIGVDPFNSINRNISTGANTTGDLVVNNELFCFVQFHKPEYNIKCVECLGVCRGRLRMCHYEMEDPYKSGIVCVWELKEVEEEDDQKADGIAGRLMKWCFIKKLNLNEMVAENLDIDKWRAEAAGWWEARVRAFDPNDEDILYVNLDGDIVACNFRTRTLFTRQRIRPTDVIGGEFRPWAKAFPLSLKRWPTPVPN